MWTLSSVSLYVDYLLWSTMFQNLSSNPANNGEEVPGRHNYQQRSHGTGHTNEDEAP